MVMVLLLAFGLIIAIRMLAGQGMGETALVSFGWGVVNCLASAAGGLLAVFICGRR